MQFAREMVTSKLIGVNRICLLLGISKATYYNARDPEETFLQKYEYVKKYILKVVRKYPYYGIRRIKVELNKTHEITIGRDVLGKLLICWGLSLPRRTKKRKISLIEKILRKLRSKANILAKSTITTVFQAVTTDITRLEYQGGYCYLCVYKDVLDQMVYGWSVSETMNVEFVLQAFNMMKKKIVSILGFLPLNLIIHQDQGSQYTSYKYVRVVLEVFRLSYSTPGTPTDNPGQESFFGRLKDELRIEIADMNTTSEVKRLIKRRMKVYNEERLHTSIGYTTPKNFTLSLLGQITDWFSFFRT